jgi:hypothetical protein
MLLYVVHLAKYLDFLLTTYYVAYVLTLLSKSKLFLALHLG